MFHVTPFGDRGLRIQFGDAISPETNQRIRSFTVLLEKENIPGVEEWIPAYTALTVFYDPYVVKFTEMKQVLLDLYECLPQVALPPAQVIHIPTRYGAEKGPDLADVAKHNGLDEQTVVEIHSRTPYLIYMMGFTPGFPYLGGMSRRIATPRLPKPRPKIPAGSVGIAGEQTGIYSMETPGGWRIIGQTPVKLYDPEKTPPVLLKAGNYIQFVPISDDEFDAIRQAVVKGTYEPHIEHI